MSAALELKNQGQIDPNKGIYTWNEHRAEQDFLLAWNAAVLVWSHLQSGGSWPTHVSCGLFRSFIAWSKLHNVQFVCDQGLVTVN